MHAERTPLTKEIQDDDGNTHRYVVHPFPAQTGVKLSRRILPLLEGPVALIVALKKEDAGAMGAALKALATALATEGDARMMIELLQFAARDGQKAGENFDMIYTLNYGELIEALIEVIRFNFGKTIERLLKGDGPLAKLLGGLGQ